jgi:hypothetical protein
MTERPPFNRPDLGTDRSATDPVVFLSYAHAEKEIALAFSEALKGRGLGVLLDATHLQPGQSVEEFARQCVKDADATVCLVSALSLSSEWVVFEAVSTLHKERSNQTARLIACATDQSFFNSDFRLTVTKSINDELKQIDAHLAEYLAQQLDMTDLSATRSRLLAMRTGLGEVLERLRESLTLTLNTSTLLDTATRVADHLRALRGLKPTRMDRRDSRARAGELRAHLWDGRTDDALGRLLDFVTDFSHSPKHRREATLISNTWRRTEVAEKDGKITFDEAEKQRQPMIERFLGLIDEIELDPQLPMAS